MLENCDIGGRLSEECNIMLDNPITIIMEQGKHTSMSKSGRIEER